LLKLKYSCTACATSLNCSINFKIENTKILQEFEWNLVDKYDYISQICFQKVVLRQVEQTRFLEQLEFTAIRL